MKATGEMNPSDPVPILSDCSSSLDMECHCDVVPMDEEVLTVMSRN